MSDQVLATANKSSLRDRGARIAGIRLTHPDRVLYPRQGVTKRELAEYYEAIADSILPHLVGRPLTLVRCPQGRGGKCFYQKHLTESMPGQLRGVEVEEETGSRAAYVVVDDLAGLISLVQISALELHPWQARADRLDRPDRLVFDLDPGEAVQWSAVVQAARDVRSRLNQFDLQSFLRTSGGKGLHVVVPIVRRATWDTVKSFCKSIADELASDFPDRYVATSSKARRRGKVFIDYLRNQRGATSIASYSTRSRQNAPVAAPLRWDELDAGTTADDYHIRNLLHRLASLQTDPWEGFFDIRQSVSKNAAPVKIAK